MFERIALTFPGQEKRIESDDPQAPEQSLLTRILTPYQTLAHRLSNLKNVVGFGNSFGYFAALVAAEAMTLPDALNLVGGRGKIVRGTEDEYAHLEEEAQKREEDTTFMGRTGMLRLIAFPQKKRQSLQDKHRLHLSNDYGPIVVVTGRIKHLTQVQQELNIGKRAAILDVDGAYHDPIRQADSKEFAKLVESTRIIKSQYPIISSTNPKPTNHPDEIREELVGMMVRPVILREILEAFKKEGIGIALDLDQSASFQNLAGKVDEAKGWLRLLNSATDMEQFFNLFSDSGQLLQGPSFLPEST